MAAKSDGGPAFPKAGGSEGMSQRDWLTGMVVNGVLASGTANLTTPEGRAAFAKIVIGVVDAMLKERE